MPKRDFNVPQPHKSNGWKIKVRGREYVEDPHISIIFKTTTWRFNIRDLKFMDISPDPSDIPDDVLEHIKKLENLAEYEKAWDEEYGKVNPVNKNYADELKKLEEESKDGQK